MKHEKLHCNIDPCPYAPTPNPTMFPTPTPTTMFPTPAPTFCDGNTTQLTPKLPEHFCFRDTADQIDYFTTRVKACKAACLNYAKNVGTPTKDNYEGATGLDSGFYDQKGGGE